MLRSPSLSHGIFVAGRNQSRPAIRRQRLLPPRKNIGILRDQGKCRTQDSRGGAPVLLQCDQLRIREKMPEEREGGARSSPKLVNRLVWIADRENVALLARQQMKNH